MKNIFLILIMIAFFSGLKAQEEKKFVRKGNRQYSGKNYSEAEVYYRKALEKQANSGVASYNLGNTLYRQNKFEDAEKEFSSAANTSMDKKEIAKAYHNLGNSYLHMQKFKESIEAYKKALKNNPNDMETKYNLSFAQKKLKENPNQQNQNQNQDQNKDQNKDQQDKNKDQNKQDQNKDQNDQNKDQNKDDQQNQDKQDQNQANKDNKMSKEQAEQILQAIQNDENNTQDKLKKEKAAGRKANPEIDW